MPRFTTNVEFGRGEVVSIPPCGSPYKAVLHAVGVDAFYDTSADVVTAVVAKALQMAAEQSAAKVVWATIAMGYGRHSLEEFAAGVRPGMECSFPPITEVALCLRNRDDTDTLSRLLRKAVTSTTERDHFSPKQLAN